MVSLMPAFSFSLLRPTRSASRSVMSASSNWVTCGIMTQLRARLAPEIFLIFDSGFDSISPNLEKSICGHGSRFSPAPPPLDAARGAAPPASACLTKFCTSSRVMRPLRSLPLTLNRSTPSSRANRRTAGLACGTFSGITVSAPNATGGDCGPIRSGSTSGASAAISISLRRIGLLVSMVALAAAFASAAGGTGVGSDLAGTGAAAGGGGAAFFATELSVASASMIATTVPSEISSPSLTLSSLTTPATDEGTSIVALSDSSVTRPWSLLTVSPGLTRTSMTGMPV